MSVDPSRRRDWVLGVAAILTTIGVALQFDRDPPTPEERVAACREDHDVATPDHTAVPPPRLWATCNWPPPPGADEDGYSEVRVTEVANPELESLLEQTDHTLWVFTSDCRRLEWRWYYDKMQDPGTVLPPERSDVGMVLDEYGEPRSLPLWAHDLSPPPFDDPSRQLGIVTGVAHRVYDLRCI